MYNVSFEYDINLGARLVPNTAEGLTITPSIDIEYNDPNCEEWMAGGVIIPMNYLPKEGDIISLMGFLDGHQLQIIHNYEQSINKSVSLYRKIKSVIFQYDIITKDCCHVAWISDFENTVYPCDIV